MLRRLHLVADWPAADRRATGPFLRRLAQVMPDVAVEVHPVAPGDSLAAGCCVAHLVAVAEDAPRMIAHDVAPAEDEGPGRWCVGRCADGTVVLGTDVGWEWSFLRDALRAGPHRVDVPARRAGDPGHARLASAIRHVSVGHPHAVNGLLPYADPPEVPASAVAWTLPGGNLQTTIPALPARAGVQCRVAIGEVSATALVTDAASAPASGELVLVPAPLGVQLALHGGSAARRFGSPPSGTHVSLE